MSRKREPGIVARVLELMHVDCWYSVAGIAQELGWAPSQVQVVMDALARGGMVVHIRGEYQKVKQKKKRAKAKQVDWVNLA